ncbi:hypothetical protein [Mastigocladopsis repens]|uniref:hypothetical protein n=1 Tax=Mastigocladopsis repens TaxID=221287 RepID=UPI000314BA9B|nr:hypothetical protein [Mastigocladopsis repens]
MPQNRLTKDSSNKDPFVQQFFARIPSKTAGTFTDVQLAALKQVFQGRLSKRHVVDIKLSIPFPKQGLYVVFLLGKEKRSKERSQTSTFSPVNKISLTILGLVLMTSLLGSLYIVKMTAETDSFPQKEIQIKESQPLSNI